MTRRDWWIGVAVVVFGLLFHALWPRYEWRIMQNRPPMRVDRWTGAVERGEFTTEGLQTTRDLRRAREQAYQKNLAEAWAAAARMSEAAAKRVEEEKAP